MQHTDFLKSLKTLKSHLLKHKTTKSYMKNTFQTREVTTCSCTDAKGEIKYLYSSQKELTYLLSKKDIKLYVYPCPYEKGWHLTKN